MRHLRVAPTSLWFTLVLAACAGPEGSPLQNSETGGRDAASGGARADKTSKASGGTAVKTSRGATTATTNESRGGSSDSGSSGDSGGSGGSKSTTKAKTTDSEPSTGGQQSGGTSTKGTTSSKDTATTANPAGGSSSQGGTSGQGGTRSTGVGKQGERFPFPQNVKYPHGVQSTKVTNEFVRSWYDNWKKTRLVECNGNLMPAADSSSISKVEAQGFAMVAVAYMGDKDVFDKLYKFYLSKTSSTGCGLSGWQTNCGGVQDAGAATDGDIDVASGLVVAHWQWPDAGYDEKAKTLISNLRKMILECNGLWTVYPGCGGGRPWGGCNETDISYYSPAFFRYFAKISGDQAWAKAADDNHKIRDAAANSNTGLVPDWQSVSGTPGAGSRSGNFAFDAIRAPYKQCLDYLWNGTPAAETWCKKISTWAYGVGVDKLRDGYQLNGSQTSNNHNLAVVGSMAVASMANTQEIADAFVAESARMRDDYWYSSYLGNLYLLALSGNMWNPDILGVE